MNSLTKKIIAVFMATIMMMSAFGSYASIAASAAQTDGVVTLTAGKDAQKTVTPDKETEEEPLEETSDLNFREEIRNFFHRIVEIIRAFISFFLLRENPAPAPEPEPELF